MFMWGLLSLFLLVVTTVIAGNQLIRQQTLRSINTFRQLSPGQSHYEEFSIGDTNTGLEIHIDVCGEIEVYVKLSDLRSTVVKKQPNVHDYDLMQGFASTQGIMSISKADLHNYCVGICYMQVTIFSWVHSKYDLHIQKGGLLQGTLQQDQFNRHSLLYGQYMYFFVYIPSKTKNIEILVNTISGDADLYVILGPNREESTGKKDHHYRSNNYGLQEEHLTVHENDDSFCTNCYASIAVYGFESTIFEISTHMNDDLVDSKLTVNKQQNSSSTSTQTISLVILILCSILLTVLLLALYCRAKRRSDSAYRSAEIASNNCQAQYAPPSLAVSREELLHYISLAEGSHEDEETEPFFT